MDAKVFKDYLIKHKKLVVAAAVIVGLLYLIYAGREKPPGKGEVGKGKGNITTEERLKVEIEGLKKSIEELKKQKPEQTPKGEEKKGQEKPKEEGKPAEKQESLKDLEKALGRGKKEEPPREKLPPPQGGVPGTAMDLQKMAMAAEPRLIKIDIAEISRPESRPQGRKETDDLYLPSGSFASFTLTSGAYAPETGEQMPVAGVIDKAFIGPNKSGIPLRGCFFLGKARGNTGEKIADIKAVKLSCVFPDGRSFDADIAGYITGLNGDFGLPGRVERHSGDFFATVGITSFLEGFSTGMARAQESESAVASGQAVEKAVNIVGAAAKYGFFRGMLDFTSAAKQFYAAQLQSLVPAVVVQAGSKGYVFITSGVTIPGGRSALNVGGQGYYDSYNLSSNK